MENWLGSSLNQIQGWTAVRESYSRALEQGPLDEVDHGAAFVKSGLRFAGFYRRGVRSGSVLEMNPSYSTITYGAVDVTGEFTGVNISQVIHQQYRLVQKKGTVLLRTSTSVAGCGWLWLSRNFLST